MSRAFLSLLLTLPGCASIKRMLPEAPALDVAARTALDAGDPATVTYTDPAQAGFPVLPVMVFGAAYDLDLVIVSKHPEWNMHEYARMDTPDGPVWLAKDARESTMSQSIVADIDDIERWWPEIPVQRKSFPLKVDDRSTDKRVDISLSYENIDGEPVEITYRGTQPKTRMKKRNGSTMGHSRGELMAVLDLHHRNFGSKATVRINGEKVRLERLAGLLPFRMALQQVQGGLASGRYSQSATDDGFAVVHHTQAGDVEVPWTVDHEDGRVVARTHSRIRSLEYSYLNDSDRLELVEVTATQWGRDDPTAHLVLNPALPDLRRRFDGRHVSHYAVDINGQKGHAMGRLEAWWDDTGPRVALIPEAPWWTADRPMETQVVFVDGSVNVTIERTEPAPGLETR